jgi:hypothetical protein
MIALLTFALVFGSINFGSSNLAAPITHTVTISNPGETQLTVYANTEGDTGCSPFELRTKGRDGSTSAPSALHGSAYAGQMQSNLKALAKRRPLSLLMARQQRSLHLRQQLPPRCLLPQLHHQDLHQPRERCL